MSAIVDINEHAPGLTIAEKLGIPYGSDWKAFLTNEVHVVFDVTGEKSVFDELMDTLPNHTLLIPGFIANMLVGLSE